MQPLLPSRLWLVRHGESAGNVARDNALAAGTHTIEILERDMDVPLSSRGQEQADALRSWFVGLPPDQRPQVIFSSPYARAWETAVLLSKGSNWDAQIRSDERLREKEFGSLDRLTKVGIEARYPEQARLRSAIGKFYYRPPGGESWCDVVLRLRSAFESLCLQYAGKRVLIVSHQVVVLCFRYLIEDLDERSLLAIDRQADVANCSITEYELQDAPNPKLRLLRYNFLAPLERAGAAVTSQPDIVAAR
jgi:probable phosphoglycerate mutase